MAVKYKAGLLITVNKARQRENTPEQSLAFHATERAWWSSKHWDDTFYPGLQVFVRFAGTNEVIGRAVIEKQHPVVDPHPPDPDLPLRYVVRFLNRTPVRGVYLRDFGITGGRARQAVIGLRSVERDRISAALDRHLDAWREDSHLAQSAKPITVERSKLGLVDQLRSHIGQWVAIKGEDVVGAADTADDLVRWLRRHEQTADRMFRVPGSEFAASGVAPL
jgi:hypothetical protein